MKKFLLFLVALLVVTVVVAALAWSFGSRRTQTVFASGDRVLSWTLSGSLPDHEARPQFPFATQGGQSLSDVYLALTQAARDDSLRVLALTVDGPAVGLARAQELLRLFGELKSAGVRIECNIETFGEGRNGTLDYYLTTACDRISLSPAGDVNLLGLFWDRTFFRGTLDKLKVEPDFYHSGTYKGTGETYMRSDSSAESTEAHNAILDDLHGQIVGAIGAARGLAEPAVLAAINGAPYVAEEALAVGLIDEIEYADEFRARLEEAHPEAAWVGLGDYSRGARHRGGGQIAVVAAQGVITRSSVNYDPWTQERYVGSGNFVELLDSLAEDDRVRAVVLRVNSPGGSALASDLILRSVEQLAAVKPVIVSMSDIAASGGYYIAAKAEKIVAEPATITGSIGVVFGKVATRAFEQELLGITHDTLQRGNNADYFSLLDKFSESQAERVAKLMDRTYQRFLDHVAEGRGLTPERARLAAEGRVWTGAQAVNLGLVDELGGFGRSIELAAESAGLEADDVSLSFYPRTPSFWRYLEERQASRIASLLKPFPLPLETPGGLELPVDSRALASPF